MATRTLLKLRPDVTFAASGRSKCYIGTHFLLHQDISFTASERIFLPFSPVKLQKTIEKA